jgi:hypothetical protein
MESAQLQQRGARAPAVVLRVTVRVPDLDSFITRYSRFIDGDRIFICTKNPQPPGTRVRFSIHLSNGEPTLAGNGKVIRCQAEAPELDQPSGMELAFVAADDRSQTLVDFMLASRAEASESEAEAQSERQAAAEIAAEPSVAQPLPLPPPPAGPPPSVQAPPPVLPPLRTEELRKAILSKGHERTRVAKVAAPTPPPPPIAAPSTDATKTSALFAATAPSLPALPLTIESPQITVPESEEPGPDAASPKAAGALPAVAEAWREAPPEAVASAAPEVPANPFSDVSDGAIDYFVEWSLEQSIGQRADQSASFANVPMALPTSQPHALSSARQASSRQTTLILLAIALSAPSGGVVGWTLRSLRAHKQAVVAAPPPPPVAPEPPAVAPPLAPLTISTRPPGAALEVDGHAAGVSPLTLQLQPGTHTIQINKERYQPVNWSGEVPGNVDVALKRPEAVLHVQSTPRGAEVLVNGRKAGITPIDVKLPGFEHYPVVIRAPGRQPWQKTVYLQPPSAQISATLTAAPAPPRPTR